MTAPVSFSFRSKSLRVLKTGKFTVLVTDYQGREVVFKVAQSAEANIEREVACLRDLSQSYRVLGSRLPAIIGSGLVTDSQFAGKPCYAMEYLPGGTLSDHIKGGQRFDRRKVSDLPGLLLDHVAEHVTDPDMAGRSGRWVAQKVRDSLARLHELPELEAFLKAREIEVNGLLLLSLPNLLDRIEASSVFADWDGGPSCISRLGHWNFHAENILLTDQGPLFIDPDTKIADNDPFFGISRLLYSLVHDSAEAGNYLIHQWLPSVCAAPHSVTITYSWAPEVLSNYRKVVSDPFAWSVEEAPFLTSGLPGPTQDLRLTMNFLHCLLRGAYINRQPRTEGSADTGYRNNGVLLFLAAWTVTERLVRRLAL
ncbi:hypothetical protein JCM17960_34410 [Magnetospira thiophila]